MKRYLLRSLLEDGSGVVEDIEKTYASLEDTLKELGGSLDVNGRATWGRTLLFHIHVESLDCKLSTIAAISKWEWKWR